MDARVLSRHDGSKEHKNSVRAVKEREDAASVFEAERAKENTRGRRRRSRFGAGGPTCTSAANHPDYCYTSCDGKRPEAQPGVRKRTRAVAKQAKWGGKPCAGQSLVRELACNTLPCKVDCGYLLKQCTPCSKACGGRHGSASGARITARAGSFAELIRNFSLA